MTTLFFGSTMGNTEEVANKIAGALGIECVNINSASPDDLSKCDKLILGTSTWGDGDLQEDWEAFDLDSVDVSGKTIALFGLGDSSGYPDTFCQAMSVIYDKLKSKGANFIGSVSADEYDYESSKSVVDGKFIGLALDNDNEGDKTDARVDAWIASIKSEIL